RVRRAVRKHWRLLLAAAICLLSLVGGATASSWQALRATRAETEVRVIAERMEAERDRARLALTQQIAERLDGDLRRLAMAGQVLAATLGQRTDFQESHLEAWMRTILDQDERIFGMSLAFEPGQFDPTRDDYCLYVYRGPNAVEKKLLLPPDYMPLYRDWEWYRKPMQEQRARWSDPYIDTGGGEIPMVTYSAPFHRAGRPAGVLTIDLSVQYFEVLRGWLKELHLGKNSYGFVLSSTGVIVSHPHPDYDFARIGRSGKRPPIITELSGADSSFAALSHQFQEVSTGSGVATDPFTGKPATFLFAPVPSADWIFVAAIEDAVANVGTK
ncbi:MAG: hypothetical protein KJ060_00990, partial [Candidatus Hydrogenedentes bacterium]|nr:hypothetical protein [Candidatus Hydrogenedentota bacterium]